MAGGTERLAEEVRELHNQYGITTRVDQNRRKIPRINMVLPSLEEFPIPDSLQCLKCHGMLEVTAIETDDPQRDLGVVFRVVNSRVYKVAGCIPESGDPAVEKIFDEVSLTNQSAESAWQALENLYEGCLLALRSSFLPEGQITAKTFKLWAGLKPKGPTVDQLAAALKPGLQ